jgi:hypothetical protein
MPSPRSDDLRAQRRNAFLRKVRDGRDERRFELREDDVSLLSLLSYRKL